MPKIIATNPRAVTFTTDIGDGEIIVTWDDLIAAARQPDQVLAAAYRSLLDRAIDAEVARVFAVPVELCSEIEQEAPCQFVTRVWWEAAPYVVRPAARAADEGGSLYTIESAKRERDDRVRRSEHMVGRHARSIASAHDIRRGVLAFHGIASPVRTDTAVCL